MPTEQVVSIDPVAPRPIDIESPFSAKLEKVTISVSGMTCAACQGRVQRALEMECGVAAASVNLMLKNAVITYDPAATSPDRLVSAIRRTGYDAEPPTSGRNAFDQQAAQDAAQEGEYRDLRRKAVVAGIAGLVAMVLSMPLMVAGEGGSHEIGSFMPWAMPATSWLGFAPPAVWSYVLLFMTALIMGWIGRHFYIRAWSAFRHRSADMNTLVAVGTGAAFL